MMHKVLVLFFLGFNIKSCVKSLFGTVSMEMRQNITRGHSVSSLYWGRAAPGTQC